MKKILAASIAVSFALGSLAALAQDKTVTPTTPEEQAKMKAERDALRAERAKMTPEEKAAAKKAARHKKQKDVSKMEVTGNPNAPSKAAADAKATEASKGQPKPLPDAKAKREALKQQEKQGQ